MGWGCARAALKSAVQHKKNGPRIDGGQVALVLSRCESFVGGLTAGWPLAQERSLGGGWPRTYGRSAPVEAAALWGDAAAWAAKLFSIRRMCTVLVRTRSGFAPVSLESVTVAFPSATACIR